MKKNPFIESSHPRSQRAGAATSKTPTSRPWPYLREPPLEISRKIRFLESKTPAHPFTRFQHYFFMKSFYVQTDRGNAIM